jgi:tRNA-modifying protein YgfZ
VTEADQSLADDYAALRHGVGAYRLPRDVVSVCGPDASAYLQGQVSQDLAPLGVGASAPALLLEPDGKLCALVRVVRTADDGYVLDTDAGFGERVAARLLRFRLRTKVDIQPLDWPCVALRGDGVPAPPPPGETEAVDLGEPWLVAVEWNGTRGVDRLGPGAEDHLPDGARWVQYAAWESLRVEAGIPAMGRELDERTIAAEAGLVERTVSFTKGCYTGQELVARLDARGSRVARRLVGIVAQGLDAADAGWLGGASLWTPGRDTPVGRCTSAAPCPGVGAPGGLAYLHRSVEVPATLTWTRADPEAGTTGADDGRGGTAEARPLPLVG